MNLLILGGQSPRHKQWVRDVAASAHNQFQTVTFIDYEHWDRDDNIDISGELAKAFEAVKSLSDYVIVAKSIGSVIATLGVAQGKLRPARCIFLGFPLHAVEQSFPELVDAIKQLPPTVFVHNSEDPLGSAEAVKKYLDVNHPEHYSLTELPGGTHDYLDFDLILRLALA